MRKAVFHILLTLCLLTTAVGMNAQTTMRDIFKAMPDSLVPYLSENNRLDLIDFLDSNMKAEVTNLLGGKSTLLQLTDSYLSLLLNEASTLDMLLLPYNGSDADSATQVVCMVRTVGSDVRVSTVTFYTPTWQPLPTSKFINLPGEPVVAVLNADGPAMTLVPETKLDFPANEEQKAIQKPSINLKWNSERFKED